MTTAREDAITRVKLLGATDARPAIDDTAVAAAVDAYALVDVNGVSPTAGLAWVPTFDVNAAVAEVYRIKAANVAGDFSFTADDASFSKGDVLAHLLQMEAKYAALAKTGQGQTAGNLAGTITVQGTNQGYVNQLDYIAQTVIP